MEYERVIDLDANATTRLDPRVLERVSWSLEEDWANPSSEHVLGSRAREAIEEARQSLADLIGAGDPQEIVFTASATEAINLGIQGSVRAGPSGPFHVISSLIEHKAVLEILAHLEDIGVIDVSYIKPDRQGRVEVEQVASVLRSDTRLVCLTHGNNEIGTISPIEAVGEMLAGLPSPPLFFVDAAQTGAYGPPNTKRANIHLLCVSSHKMYGPKGAAALYVRRDSSIRPILFGGGQESGLRPGTQNTHSLVGFGLAAAIARIEGGARAQSVTRMRESFLEQLKQKVPDLQLNGDPLNRLPGNLSLTFPYVSSRMLQKRLPQLAFSRGSACMSGTGEDSHVLRGIGLPKKERHWTIRIGISCMTTDDQVSQAVKLLGEAVVALRGGGSLRK